MISLWFAVLKGLEPILQMKWTNKYISIYIISYQPDYNDLL